MIVMQQVQQLKKAVIAITIIVYNHPPCKAIIGMTNMLPPIMPLTKQRTVVGKFKILPLTVIIFTILQTGRILFRLVLRLQQKVRSEGCLQGRDGLLISIVLIGFYQQQNKTKMGCASGAQAAVKPIRKVDTVFGSLQIKVLQAVIENETSTVFAMDPYVNIKFSNQSFKGEVIKKGGKNPKFKDTATFYVNSQYKHYGRCLQIELMDSNVASDDVIGYGIIDLDPYLKSMQMQKSQGGDKGTAHTTDLRCFLNSDRKQAGFVTLQATFKEQSYEHIHFRFQTADFQRRTRTFGDMKCSVRVTVGQQVLQTKVSMDSKTNFPCWKDQHLSFVCLAPIEEILIELMDEENQIGYLTIEKRDFIKEKDQQNFNRNFIYKTSIAGKVKFNTLTKINPVFKELNGVYTKKTEEDKKKQEDAKKKKAEDEKKQQQKQEKKQQKPQEKKQEKPQEKKQQKKPQ